MLENGVLCWRQCNLHSFVLEFLNANISKTKQQRYEFLFIFRCIASKYVRTQKNKKKIAGRVNYVYLALTPFSFLMSFHEECNEVDVDVNKMRNNTYSGTAYVIVWRHVNNRRGILSKNHVQRQPGEIAGVLAGFYRDIIRVFAGI